VSCSMRRPSSGDHSLNASGRYGRAATQCAHASSRFDRDSAEPPPARATELQLDPSTPWSWHLAERPVYDECWPPVTGKYFAGCGRLLPAASMNAYQAGRALRCVASFH
jgi:hypothetical protein